MTAETLLYIKGKYTKGKLKSYRLLYNEIIIWQYLYWFQNSESLRTFISFQYVWRTELRRASTLIQLCYMGSTLLIPGNGGINTGNTTTLYTFDIYICITLCTDSIIINFVGICWKYGRVLLVFPIVFFSWLILVFFLL